MIFLTVRTYSIVYMQNGTSSKKWYFYLFALFKKRNFVQKMNLFFVSSFGKSEYINTFFREIDFTKKNQGTSNVFLKSPELHLMWKSLEKICIVSFSVSVFCVSFLLLPPTNIALPLLRLFDPAIMVHIGKVWFHTIK